MLLSEKWETASARDAGDIVRKALRNSERYVRAMRLDRMTVGDEQRIVIEIEYGRETKPTVKAAAKRGRRS